MIDDAPYNHYVRCFRGLSFNHDLDLSLDALHLSGPSYHTSGEEGVTSVAMHLLQSIVADAADVPGEVLLVHPRGYPLHFSSMHIRELCGWLVWTGLTCEIYTADLT